MEDSAQQIKDFHPYILFLTVIQPSAVLYADVCLGFFFFLTKWFATCRGQG